MSKERILKKVIILLLIISLLNANLNIALFGLISYAIDNNIPDTEVILEETTMLPNEEETVMIPNEEEIQENEDNKHSEIIESTITKAELGIDKSKISTVVENSVNFTITMYTHDKKYDLYKNPKFVIELPKEIENISIVNNLVINNKYFGTGSIDIGTTENGNKIIIIELQGEQTEYTKSMEENTQILIEATIVTSQLIPTLEREIILQYENENAKVYEENQMLGKCTEMVELVSNKTILTETKAIIGEEIISSLQQKNIIIEPNTYKELGIIGTVINNTGKDINNAKILGTVSNIGQISGVEEVYYTENPEANIDLEDANNGWSKEYTNNTKKYLIVIENFIQGQTLTFGYSMNLLENIEENTEYVAEFEVYNEKSEILKTSKMTVCDKAERFNIYEDENVKVEITTDLTGPAEVAGMFDTKITITNKTNETIENADIEIKLPEGLKTTAKSTDEEQEINEITSNDSISIENLKLEKQQTIVIEKHFLVTEYIAQKQEIQVQIKYADISKEITEKIEFVKPSKIEATITSNKIGQKVQIDEGIEYLITLKNVGESHAVVNIELPETENMDIVKIEAINTTTGAIDSITGGNVDGKIEDIRINPNETIELSVVGYVNNNEGNIIMYAEITGENIENITTTMITNVIIEETIEEGIIEEIKTEEIIEESKTQEDTKEEGSSIEGIAWIDANENGIKDNKERLLKNIQVMLIDTATSQQVRQVYTDNNGQYQFENVLEGTYIVKFKYNSNTFSITDYKNSEETITNASNVVRTTQGGETTSKTEVVNIQDGNTENVNIGLVLNKRFDISINKGITKVTVDNKQGTSTYDFENGNMAKVEIDGEVLKGSLILIEYEIEVANIGEVAGYAKVISDKIPDGMKFSSELNKDWYEGTDENLYTEVLANNKLQPGEKAKIKLVLIKEMKNDKIISPVNNVKIEETYNEYLIEDCNKENNSAHATIIISLTTGNMHDYIWLALVVMAIISTGIIGVIKLAKGKVNC